MEWRRTSIALHGCVMSVERGSMALIDRLVPEWTALCAEGPCDEPFSSPAWVQAYIAEFAPGAPVLLFTVRRDGTLRAVLPLVDVSVGIGPLRIRWWRSAANSQFPRFDVIHGAGDGEVMAQLLWEYLDNWREWDLLQFESAPAGGLAWRLLDLAKTSGRATRLHRPDASPYIDLRQFPTGIDQIISSLPIKLRSQNRRSLKRLRSRGDVDFRIIGSRNTLTEVEEAVRSLYHLEASGWKGKANTAIVSDPATMRFYNRVIADALANQSLAICQLLCDGKVVAAKLDLIWNGTMYELKSGYDEAYRDCSPGHLLKAYAVDVAARRGIAILDNCGRADPHKLAWTSLSKPFAACFIGNSTVRGRVAWTLLFRVGSPLRRHLKRMPLPRVITRLLG